MAASQYPLPLPNSGLNLAQSYPLPLYGPGGSGKGRGVVSFRRGSGRANIYSPHPGERCRSPGFHILEQKMGQEHMMHFARDRAGDDFEGHPS